MVGFHSAALRPNYQRHAGDCRRVAAKAERLTLAATILGSSMAFIDGSVVNIGASGDPAGAAGGAASTQWIVNCPICCSGRIRAGGGSAADLYGRRQDFPDRHRAVHLGSIACGPLA